MNRTLRFLGLALGVALVAWLVSFDVDGLLLALRAYVSLAITR